MGATGNDVEGLNALSTVPAQVYDDNLGFYVDFNRLMTINLVDIDKYIAGVVEAEAGPIGTYGVYKAQALLARTYAYSHGRHMMRFQSLRRDTLPGIKSQPKIYHASGCRRLREFCRCQQ